MKLLGEKKQNSNGLCILAEIIYMLMFNLMLGIKMAGFYDGQKIFKLVFVVYMLLFAVKMIITSYTAKEYLFISLLIILAGVVYIQTGEKGLFLCFSMMAGIKGVSVLKTLKLGAVVSSIILASKIFLSVFGFIPEKYYATYRIGVGEQIRHSLGYVHPNTLHISFFALTILVVYVATKEKFHVYLISIAFAALNIYIYMYSGSRTGFLCTMIYIILNAWNFNRNKMSIIEKVLCFLAYPVMCAVTIVLPMVLHGKWFLLLDDYVFNLRFSIAKYYFEHNELSLFGIRLNNPDKLPYSIDMAGMYLFLQLGIIAFIVISVLSIWYTKKAIEYNMTAELSVFVAICIAGLWEPFLYNTSYKNIAFVFIGIILLGMPLKADDHEERSAAFLEKKSLFGICMSFFAAIIACVVFLLVTDPYTALYADQAAPILNQDDVREPIYLTPEAEKNVVENGAIVLRYENQDSPVYEYSIITAHHEYQLKAVSVFVFCIVIIFTLWKGVCTISKRSGFKYDQKC